jgi:hypothetical protein
MAVEVDDFHADWEKVIKRIVQKVLTMAMASDTKFDRQRDEKHGPITGDIAAISWPLNLEKASHCIAR